MDIMNHITTNLLVKSKYVDFEEFDNSPIKIKVTPYYNIL